MLAESGLGFHPSECGGSGLDPGLRLFLCPESAHEVSNRPRSKADWRFDLKFMFCQFSGKATLLRTEYTDLTA